MDKYSEEIISEDIVEIDSEGNVINIDRKHFGKNNSYYGTKKTVLRDSIEFGCLTGDMKILNIDGEYKPISNLIKGEEIIGVIDGKSMITKVTIENIYTTEYEDYVIINGILKLTSDQPICLEDKRWKRVSELKSNDILMYYPFSSMEVKSLEKIHEKVKCYCIDLDYDLSFIAEGFILQNLSRKQSVLPKSYDIFLSYSEKDERIASIIYETLNDLDVDVFLSRKNVSEGERFQNRIKDALISCEQLWVILSENSIGSEWVITEWGSIWTLGKKIVPILYHCEITDIPERLRDFNYIQYEEWPKLLRSITMGGN